MTDQKIGRYEVKTEIAKGGMATVFQAYDPSFERDVAIKVLPKTFLHDPQFRTRFEREAKMIALLEHPAIVPVYDFGEDDGQPYIVMRYMAGASLTERLDQGPLSLSETSQMIARLAPALDAAHARRIIHRDLKPGNVLFDQYGNAYLSDFGIARLSEQAGVTLTGTSIVGTPAYMSPEQVQGDKEIDGRSDIYSLGVMIFQMLTGQTPYQGDSPAKVMMMHVLQPVPSIRDVKPDLPEAVDVAVQKSMAKAPTDRYSTVDEFAKALDAIAHNTFQIPQSSLSETVSGAGHGIPASEMATAYASGPTVMRGAPAAGAKAGAAQAPVKRKFPIAAIIAGVAVVAILAIAGILAASGSRGSGPLAFLAGPSATATIQPTDTQAPTEASTATSIPTQSQGGQATFAATDTEIPATPTETLPPEPVAPVIGGADKVAFINESDIWIANLDGSELLRLTEDGTEKSQLQWTPDGNAVNYISGKCIFAVQIDSGRNDLILCLNFVSTLKEFEISPDGSMVAMSVDNQMFMVPYDIEKLNQVTKRSGLTELAECKDWAPYLRHFVKYIRWSDDMTRLGMVIMGVGGDLVTIVDITQCTPEPETIDNFPPPRFRPEDYTANPTILNFGWDGTSLFSMNTFIRNSGFGNLDIYNGDLFKASVDVNPINDSCCYRDSNFTPDGSHLFFAFQQYPGGDGSIVFYIIPYGTIGTGVVYQPIPLPPITDPKTAPEAALRQAK